MELSATFVRLFARLVWLLIHDGDNVDEQKMSLRAAIAIGKQGAVRLTVAADGLYADDERMLAVMPGVSDLAARLRAGSLAGIEFERHPAPGELFGLARALARVDPEHPAPGLLREQPGALRASTLRLVDRRVDDATPALPEPVATSGPPAAPDLEIAPPAAPAPPVDLTEAPPADTPEATEPLDARAADVPAYGADANAAVPGLVSHDAGDMFFQFSAIGSVKDSPAVLLERLEQGTNPAETIRLLDDVVTLADTAAREGKPVAVVELLHGVITREPSATDADVKRAYVMALRRLSKPLLLRAVAGQLLSASERRDDVLTILVRTGQDGAEAMIDQVTQAQTSEDRGLLFDVLSTLEAAVPALVTMLGDARWFVARNAADLLGEMKAVGAERALVTLLRHDDERVRRAATNALMQLGSESARQAVREAVRDHAPQVRMQAAFAIAAHRDPTTATTLIAAIDAEQDSDVQLAMLLALGRIGTVEAVDRLIRAAEPERGFFKKKPTAFRVAAVQALAEVKSAVAQAALKALGSDKEKEVRDTVARLTQKARRSWSSVP
jgi:HEAT repeats/PBS lyase HEAT-like repeat